MIVVTTSPCPVAPFPGLSDSAEGQPSVYERAPGLIECGDNCFRKSANLVGLESLEVVENDPAVLFSVCHSQCNPTWQGGAVFRDQRPPVFPAGFKQKVICGIDVGPLFPERDVLDIDALPESSQRLSYTRRDVSIQQQFNLHTRIKE